MSDCEEDTYFDWPRQVTFAQIWDDIWYRLKVPRVEEEAVRSGAALTAACALPHANNARIVGLNVLEETECRPWIGWERMRW